MIGYIAKPDQVTNFVNSKNILNKIEMLKFFKIL
jgi:hypothetical protein